MVRPKQNNFILTCLISELPGFSQLNDNQTQNIEKLPLKIRTCAFQLILLDK